MLKWKSMEKLEDKTLGRKRKIGEVPGDIGYCWVKLGRPNTDYLHLVNILARAQVDQYVVSSV